MIDYNPDAQVFNLATETAYYAMQVLENGRLVNIGWGPRYSEDSPKPISAGKVPSEPVVFSSRDMAEFNDELVTYGDFADQEVTLKVSFPSYPKSLAKNEAHHIPIRDVRLRYVRHEIVQHAQPGLAPAHGLSPRNHDPRQTLRIILNDPVQPLEVAACYRVTPECDMIERWLELKNGGTEPFAVEQCYFASVHMPPGRYELTHVYGGHCREFTIQRDVLPVGSTVLESRTIVTGLEQNPFFLLNRPGQASEEAGIVYFGQLAYSGNWRLTFEKKPNQSVIIHGGYNPFEFELSLAPGEIHTTPAFALGCSREGWGGASRRMHRFIRDRVTPRSDKEPKYRPVLYNSWEATFFDVNFKGQLELAKKAASIGVELFCVDDGWFKDRSSDRTGLGDWTACPNAFPKGLGQLVKEVHGLGMQFGLWFEPENVNPDSDLYRAHPDWVLHFPGRPRKESRHALMLDLGRPEVVEYLFNALDSAVGEFQIDFIKWDMNRPATEPGSVVGKAIWRKHTEAVYDIMDRLKKKYPALVIQSCSSGGGRVDLGMFYRASQAWASDNTDALDRIAIQEGYSLAYPAHTMEAWVTHEKNLETHRILPLSTRFDVAMRGVLGIGSSLNKLSNDELKTYADYIAYYKKIRPVVQNGDLYRLQRLEEYGASVIEYVLPDGSEAVYSIAVADHQKGQLRPRAVLKGLLPDALYEMKNRKGKVVCTAKGRELMSVGLPVNMGDGLYMPAYSQTFHLKKIN